MRHCSLHVVNSRLHALRVGCCFDSYLHASLIRTREGTNGPPINKFDRHWYSEYEYHAQTLASKSLLPTVCPSQYVAVEMRGVDRQSASNEKQIDDCREPHSPDLVFVSCWPPYIPLWAAPAKLTAGPAGEMIT